MRSFLLIPMLGQCGTARRRRAGEPRGSVIQPSARPSILHALRPCSPRRAGDAAGLIRRLTASTCSAASSIVVCRDAPPRQRARARAAPRTDAAPRGTCSPTLEHALQIPIDCAPVRQPSTQMLDFAGKTDPAQVVSQIARVKMPPLAVPGKNGIAQHLEAPDRPIRPPRVLPRSPRASPDASPPAHTSSPFDEALARGDGRGEARRADAGVT